MYSSQGLKAKKS